MRSPPQLPGTGSIGLKMMFPRSSPSTHSLVLGQASESRLIPAAKGAFSNSPDAAVKDQVVSLAEVLAVAQVILDGLPERVEARPGEAADKSFVYVWQAGVGEMVAQVVQVGSGPVGAHGLAGCSRIGEGFIACGDPQPVQDPPVPGVVVEPGGVTLVPERGDLCEQGVKL